ncbi:L-rhamnose mutarotase [Gracilinema caldarium]|uniref:L-rhamnose mutarotase n=1 Tax=Gracilinema caldarium TaxID=215591 RepID=UPI0026F04F7C|nr:L-rhamnose mutarotase [Gracilinema caldarium]
MKRNAFTMYLKPGFEVEYKRRHDAIWPELKAELKKAGISDYSIYLDKKTNTLFAFQYLKDDATDKDLPNSPVVKRWWHMMADIMETNPDESPICDVLEEMFHIDEGTK